MTRIITFLSGKGGVGKTTVSTNFAEALNQAGKKVILVDANITTPNVGLHYGLSEEGFSLHDVLDGTKNIEDVIRKTSTGLMVIPGGINFKNLRRKMRKNMAREIIKLVNTVDYIIIDSSAGLGGETQLALQSSDEVIIVTNPEIPAVTDALRAKALCEENRVHLLGVIINKFTGYDFGLNNENISDFLELPIVGIIPRDVKIKMSIKDRMPVVVSYPESKSAKHFKKLVNTVSGEELFIPDKSDSKFIAWMKKLIGLKD